MSLYPLAVRPDPAYRDAEVGLRRGQQPPAVIDQLVQAGVARDVALRIVNRVGLDRAAGRLPSQRAARTDVIVGATVFSVAMTAAITAPWLAAVSGPYVVAWGPLGYGLYRFFRGLLRQ